MISPISGKGGYLKYGIDEVPIYSYSFSAKRNRSRYRVSDSVGYPVGDGGLIEETIIIQGVQHFPTFLYDLLSQTASSFILGWLNLSSGTKKEITIYANLNSLQFDFNYSIGPIPSFMWTVNLNGILNDKEISSSVITQYGDVLNCQESECDKNITTTDTNIHGGYIYHVKSASLLYTIERQNYAVSDSSNHFIDSTGVFDRTLNLNIEGDFDYWMRSLVDDAIAYDYKLFYGPSISDYIESPYMRINDINNLNVNIATGEMISATVILGAAYG